MCDYRQAEGLMDLSLPTRKITMKILIAYDGSACADRAIHDLKRAGLLEKAEALVISVAELRLPPPPASSYEIFESSYIWAHTVLEAPASLRAVEDAYYLAFQVSKLVQEMFPGWEVGADSCPGSPASEIIEKAEEWGADLVVVGSHGRSALCRLVLGSVAQRVVSEASCSVRVVRNPRSERDSPVRIVLGVDGSENSGAAVREVAARAWPKASQVRLVTSVDPWHEHAAEPEQKYAGVRAIHQSAEAILRAEGLEVSSVVKEEDPKHLLVREAESFGADSIFVGARGLGRLGRLLLGSVSTAVVAQAHCSVEVVRTRKRD
jgi:nucleotide-binding universal stress UspA family protein